MKLSGTTMRQLLTWVMAVTALLSCGHDETEPIIEPTPDPIIEPAATTGVISYTVNSNGGDGTAAKPAKVQMGETLNMTVSQTSSYTDPDGSVFTCNPEAVVKLSTQKDTLYVKDIQTLMKVQEKSKEASEVTAGEKQTKKTLQTFNVGGKEVVFDLAYDVFHHVNSREQRIEMPYVKLNAADYGAVKAEETRSAEATVSVRGIRFTPHAPQTRGTLVDSTLYDVNVAFHLEMESANTQEARKQTLAFEVEFLASIESTTEYPDPEMQFSYQYEVLGGTDSKASPFVLNSGETMNLQWTGNSQYSYFSLKDRTVQTISHKPRANVTVSASNDTLWAANKEEFEQLVAADAVITNERTSPLVTKGQKTFSIAGKEISVNWSYDAYDSINVEGTNVAVAYLELSEPQVVSVQATELPNTTTQGNNKKLYWIELRLSQQLKSVNAPETKVETIEYAVKCIGAIEVKLVKVVYRKDWEWVDSHDNMMLAYYPMVHRDRIYSTGETFTDTFRDYGHLASFYMPFSIGGEPVQTVSDGTLIRTRWAEDYRDSILIVYYSANVPSLSKVFDVYEAEGDTPEHFYITPPPGAWEEYIMDKTYENLDISLEGIEVIGADSVSTKPSGWYAYCADHVYNSFVCVYGDEFCLLQGEMHIRIYDQFLVIDGQMINFLEYRGPMDFSYHKDYITMSNGAPGFVYTTEFRRKFLEKNFYTCRIDSIYQQKPTAPKTVAASSVKRQKVTKPALATRWRGRKPQTMQLPPPYRDLPAFEYGGDPFSRKR